MYSSSICIQPELIATLDLPCPITGSSSSSSAAPQPALTTRHLDEFRASGIPDEVITACGVRSVTGQEAFGILNWKRDPSAASGGWAIPFDDPADPDCYWRVKPDHPRVRVNGDMIKYESPVGSTNRAYLPPGFDQSDGRQIVITEGEKKALSAISSGVNCLGLTGVWNWQQRRKRDDAGRGYGSRKLIGDLAAIRWKDRDVIICFDSDAADNRNVELAQQRLAEMLGKLGANIRIARLPSAPDGSKLGLDDAIVQLGAAAVGDILDRAEAPELPRLSWPDIARMMLDSEYFHSSGRHTLVYWRSTFWKWNGVRYEELPAEVTCTAAYRFLESMALAVSASAAKEVVTALKAATEIGHLLEPPCCLEERTYGLQGTPLAFSNGIHFADFDHLEDWEFLGDEYPSPAWFCTGARAFPYSEVAACPTWEAFLASSLPDPDARRLLQQWFGYVISGRLDHQKLMLLLGAPRAGKSIITTVLARIAGETSTATSTLKTLGENFGLWPLLNKQLLLIPDAADRGSCIGAVERLKAITGCDGLTVDRKYLPALGNVVLKTRVVITANQLPRFLDPSGALHRRLLVIKFEESFAGREDRSLLDKLLAELPGIFNSALTGWIDLRTSGDFVVPASSQAVLAEAEQVFSPIAAFLDEMCALDPGARVASDELWSAWQAWCGQNGHHAGSQQKLGVDLHGFLPGLKRSQLCASGGRTYFYQGIDLTDYARDMLKRFHASNYRRFGF